MSTRTLLIIGAAAAVVFLLLRRKASAAPVSVTGAVSPGAGTVAAITAITADGKAPPQYPPGYSAATPPPAGYVPLTPKPPAKPASNFDVLKPGSGPASSVVNYGVSQVQSWAAKECSAKAGGKDGGACAALTKVGVTAYAAPTIVAGKVYDAGIKGFKKLF